MEARYARTEGILIEALGSAWAAFNSASGETVLLNDESAAILEVLASGTASLTELCVALSADAGVPVPSLRQLVESGWPVLLEAGLVCEVLPTSCVQA